MAPGHGPPHPGTALAWRYVESVSAVDLAAVIVAVVCLATVAVLTVAVVSLVRTMRALRTVVEDLSASALPMVDDLHTTVAKADAELHRVDRVVGRAERIAVTVDHASRLTHRAFAPPLIKGLSLVSGAGQAGRRLRDRRRVRRSLDVATAPPGASAAEAVAAAAVPAASDSAPGGRNRRPRRTVPAGGRPRAGAASAGGANRAHRTTGRLRR